MSFAQYSAIQQCPPWISQLINTLYAPTSTTLSQAVLAAKDSKILELQALINAMSAELAGHRDKLHTTHVEQQQEQEQRDSAAAAATLIAAGGGVCLERSSSPHDSPGALHADYGGALGPDTGICVWFHEQRQWRQRQWQQQRWLQGPVPMLDEGMSLLTAPHLTSPRLTSPHLTSSPCCHIEQFFFAL